MRLAIERGDVHKRFTITSTIPTTIQETKSNAKYIASYGSHYNAPNWDSIRDSPIAWYTTTMSLDYFEATSKVSPWNWCSQCSNMILVPGEQSTLKRRGWTYWNRNLYHNQLPSQRCKKSSGGKGTFRWRDKYTQRRASEHRRWSKKISTPNIQRRSSRPEHAPETWHLKWAWSIPNKILIACNLATQDVPTEMPNNCEIATEVVPKDVKNNHQVYLIVYQMASQETVKATINRWWPRSHRDSCHWQRTWHGDRMRGLPRSQLYQATDRDTYMDIYSQQITYWTIKTTA